DSTYLKKGHSVTDKDGTFKRIIVWGDEYRYSYFSGLDSDEDQQSLGATAKEIAINSNVGSYPLTDIRLIGVVPSATFVANYTITEIIGNAERTERIMTDEILDGVSCKKISFLDKQQTPVCVWIAPDKGYSILRLEEDSEKFNFHTRMEVNVAQDESSGIWFPTKCVCIETDNAGKVNHRYEINVKAVSLNSKINDDIFSPKTMNVKVGATVTKIDAEDEASGNWIWDGKDIIYRDGTTLGNIRERGKGLFRYFLITTGLAMISVACFWKYIMYREKQKETPPVPNVADK
ncbi:MAG: hypothetical protein ACRC2T_06810, partial [Thermoguttaceae bacterium]